MTFTSKALQSALLLAALAVTALADPIKVCSPGGKSSLTVDLDESGRPTWSFSLGEKEVIAPSGLGFYRNGNEEESNLATNFQVVSNTVTKSDSTWETVWGEEKEIRDSHTELVVFLKQKGTDRLVNLRFRLFDEGAGLRYEFPAQPRLSFFDISREATEFRMTGDHLCWWIPGDFDTQEYKYNKSRLSEIADIQGHRSFGGNLSQEQAGGGCVQTALQMVSDDGLYINLHEAACASYPTMHLDYDKERMTFTSFLTPDRRGFLGILQTPCATPWRTVIAGSGKDILASRITLNLNEPCKIADTSWIKPMKYIGVWWTMITGTKSWGYTSYPGALDIDAVDFSKLPPNGCHGANTENVKRHIDFASAHHIDGLLVEGWNIGWENWYGTKKERVFDFVTPYPDFDLPGISEYAKSKGVKMIMHHETSASVRNYERCLHDAYALMEKYGYPAVKSGYVGDIVPRVEHHYTQFMNDHYLYCVKEAVKYHVCVNAHEANRPTGICRTYPNWVGNESARGTEYEWFAGNGPEHPINLVFTRLLGGPMDYTPGIFEFDKSKINPGAKGFIHSTICKQLSLYVTMYSPLQMACDKPEVYEQFLDAFKFIEDVPVNFEKSVYLEAEMGSHITTARKDRDSERWFVGSSNGGAARTAKVALDFLTPGKKYVATIYQDTPETSLEGNNQSYAITSRDVTSADTLELFCSEGGGAAVSLVPVAD